MAPETQTAIIVRTLVARLIELHGIGTRYWHVLDHGRIQCDFCAHECRMRNGQRGLCSARGAEDGEVRLYTYGRQVVSASIRSRRSLDHLLPGTSALSFGTMRRRDPTMVPAP